MLKGQTERIEELKKRRMRIAKERENAEKRVKFGESVVAKANKALGTSLSLDDFHTTQSLPIELDWRNDIRDSPGLVAAYVNEPRAREIVSCCDATADLLEGIIGFSSYAFVGTTRIGSNSLLELLELAKLLEDSIFYCPDRYNGIISLDYYRGGLESREYDFSLVVQGKALEQILSTCFHSVIQIPLPNPS